MTNQLETWAQYAYSLAVQAGEKIMHYYVQTEKLVPEYKADHSPLTEADKASHNIIYEALANYPLGPEGPAPILSEEGRQFPFVERQSWKCYWCVDPLDGTKEFLIRNDEFTINIALIMNQQPIIGVVYVPAQKRGYMAWREGGAYRCDEKGVRERIVTHTPPMKALRVLVSRHYGIETLQPWLARLGEMNLVYQGSALKFCALASGEADIFLRLSPTSEWDNAAGQCLLEEAGGGVFTLEGQRLSYNRSGTLQQNRFIAVGDKSSNWSRFFTR